MLVGSSLRQNFWHCLFLCLSLALSGFASAAEKLIIDTDMGADVDDVGSIAVAHYYADQGQAELLAVMVSNMGGNAGWAAPTADAINTYYQRPNVPLATNKGPAKAFAGDRSKFVEHIGANKSRFGHDLATEGTAEDAVVAYRRILNAQPNKSVSLIVVGWMSNIANLMDSPSNYKGDKIYKTGKKLLEQKLKTLIVMGGRYPSGLEFNFKFDGASASKVMSNLQVPMVFTGYELGTLVQSGDSLVNTSVNSPVREAYRLYGGGVEPFNRASWDLTAVVYAVEGLGDYFSYSEKGKNRVSSDGSNVWLSGNAKGDVYLKLKDSSARTRLRNRLNDILKTPPVSCSLKVDLSIKNPSCAANNGSAASRVSGGSAPYSYVWNTGNTSSAISGLGESHVSLKVTDSAGCSVSSSANLQAMSVETQVQHASLTGSGSASVVLSGGRTPYAVQWSTGATSSSINGLSAGEYSVTVRDTAGCVVNETLDVEQRITSSEAYLEAECALAVGSQWKEIGSSAASGDQYLQVPTSTYNMGPSSAASSILEYQLDLDQAGAYSLYAHVLTPSGGADSMWYRVNEGSWSMWHIGISSRFSWKKRTISVPFLKGSNTLEIAFREGGVQLDKLFVTRGSSQPSGIAALAGNCEAMSCPARGSACDDGNALTSNDVEDGSCGCAGTLVVSCPVAGSACDDGNSLTSDDIADGSCGCSGASACPALGSACDDGNSLTFNDREDGNCGCAGQFSSGAADKLSFEAECATQTGSQWKAVSRSGAGEGEAIRVLPGSYNFKSDKASDTRASYSFTHTQAGRLQFFARVATPSSSSDSVWFRLNSGDWTMWHIGTHSGFQWKRWPLGVNVKSGENTLEIAYREGGFELDKLYLSTSSTLPSGFGAEASNCGPQVCAVAGSTCDDGNRSTFGDIADGNCGCGGSACPVAGLACDDGNVLTTGDVSDGYCGCAGRLPGAEEISLEAECAAESGVLWRSVSSASASTGAYMAVNARSYNVQRSGSGTTELSFPFNLSSTGAYYLSVRTLTPTTGSDSLWFQVDSGKWTPWHFGVGTSFNWKRYPIATRLDGGAHTLRIAFREGGLQLDKLVLNRESGVPVGNGPAASNCL